MTGIIAALPREVQGLVRGFKADASLKRRHIHLYRLPSAIVVCAGMGADRATLAVAAAREAGVAGLLVSTGLAGACDPEVKVGTVQQARQVIDVRSGERFNACAGEAILASSNAIANVSEKRRLRETYGAAMVDMESAAVGRQAQAHGLEFRAIKAISDAYDFELETLARFASPQGQFWTAAFALHTALRPAAWPGALQLGQGSRQALTNLAEVLRSL